MVVPEYIVVVVVPEYTIVVVVVETVGVVERQRLVVVGAAVGEVGIFIVVMEFVVVVFVLVLLQDLADKELVEDGVEAAVEEGG